MVEEEVFSEDFEKVNMYDHAFKNDNIFRNYDIDNNYVDFVHNDLNQD